jgi:DNA-binding LacI/PurR family transcriptional regulator
MKTKDNKPPEMPFNIDSALSSVLCRLRERNVRSLVQMGIRQMDLIDSGALRAASGSYEELVGLPRHVERLALDAISRAAYDIFRERYRTKADLPGAFLFTDDYLARGALTALLSAGFRTGRDVLVITLANKGNVPVHADPVDLILYDPVREANAIADTLLAYLDTGVPPGTITLESTFVAGEAVNA